MSPRLLDLYCGAGGAGAGYARAGWDVLGVDITPQPHYPFAFRQADALAYLDALLVDDASGMAPFPFDAIHASPPCQSYSSATRNLWGADRADAHADLLAVTRDRLVASGLPYVIENVKGAPIRASIMLCGTMFGLRIRKHRWFETSFDVLLAPASCGDHRDVYDPWHGAPGERTADRFREAQGTPWIPAEGGASRLRAQGGDLSDAIPPAYTEWLGTRLLAELGDA